MVDVNVTIGHVVHEQRPEEISRHDWFRRFLAVFDNAEEGLEGITSWVIACPIVFSNKVDLINRLHQIDIILQFAIQRRVVMVGEDVDRVDFKVAFLDAVRAIDHELLRSKLLNKSLEQSEDNHRDLASWLTNRYFRSPLHRYVLISKSLPPKLVASLVSDDCWVLPIRQSSEWIDMIDQMPNVILEILDNGTICIELLHKRVNV